MRQVLSRQVLGKGVLTAAAASSLLSIATGAAFAHPGAVAEASHSPGVLSGNSVSVPITLSPNVCGNSVDGGAALNPSFGNTCATTSGSDTHRHDDRGGHAHDRHLSPEHAEAFERYLQEHGARQGLPGQRGEEAGHSGPRHEEPRRHAPRHAAPRHAAPRHEEARHEGARPEGRHGKPAEEECDDHPQGHPQGRPAPKPAPAEHHAPPAPEPPRSHPAPPAPPAAHPEPPAPVEEAPRPLPAPAPVEQAPPAPEAPAEIPAPLPAPAPAPAPVAEAPVPLPAPAPVEQGPAPAPAPAPPHGSTPVPLPAPAPAPVPAPAPAPAAAHATAPAPVLAETGAGQTGIAALLASALVLGGAILYRRSRTA
ncbi:chaplin [Streptomyces sp. NPDC090445]|uniref:chaplin n=1 Tax=Streptomyces sp. NPDC090445 TaxID=3365963 RepID=UPI0037F54E9F